MKSNNKIFAIGCNEGCVLRFYNREKLPKVGSKFDGVKVEQLYKSIKNTKSGFPAWLNDRSIYPKMNTVEFVDEIAPVSIANWFCGLCNLENIKNIENLNTSNVVNMQNAFRGCLRLEVMDLSGFDTSKVKNMSSMFWNCVCLKELKQKFNVSKVEDMSFMFHGCVNLELDCSKWKTKKGAKHVNFGGLCKSIQCPKFKDAEKKKEE